MLVSNRATRATGVLVLMLLFRCSGDPAGPSGGGGEAGALGEELGGAGGAGGAGDSGAGGDFGGFGGLDSIGGQAGSPKGGRSSGSAGRGGVGGSSPTSTTGGSAGAEVAGSGGDPGSSASGPGGSGGEAGGDPCGAPSWCKASGLACDGNERVECTVDESGCFVEARTNCDSKVCLEGECVENGTGVACVAPLVVGGNTVIVGTDFSADFGDQHDFVGRGCVLPSRASAEAVLAINVSAGQTVLLSESTDVIGKADTGVDAVFGFLAECSDSAECSSSGRGPDWAGVTYTATSNQTVFAFVGSEGNPNGAYEITVEYMDSLGTLGVSDTLAPVHEGAFAAGTYKTYAIRLSKDTVLYGSAKSDGGAGDLDIRVYDAQGNLQRQASPDNGPDHKVGDPGQQDFAFALKAGEYRFELTAFEAVGGYTLSLFTDPYSVLPVLGAVDGLRVRSGPIPAGRSRFYVVQLSGAVSGSIGVMAEVSGDPDIWMYGEGWGLYARNRATGLTDTVQFWTEGDSSSLLRIAAEPSAGDIPMYQLGIDVAGVAIPGE